MTETVGHEIALWTGLKTIFACMSSARRRQLLIVLILMVAGAAAELATIGAVMPFLALLANVADSGGNHLLHRFSNVGFGGDPVIAAAGLFILFAVIAGLIRLELARSSRRFIFRLGHELTLEIQRRVLLQPFSFHIHRNTSTLLTALNKTETLVYDVLLPLMQAVTGGAIAISVIALLIAVDPLTTISIAAVFAAAYAVISLATHRRLVSNSRVLESSFDERLQVVQESLGGIRDVIVDNSQAMYLGEFDRIDSQLADARAATQFISLVPRYIIEIVGMVAIAVIALVLAHRIGGIAAALPVLGALALGAQRLLPLVQEVYSGWTFVEGQRSIFSQIVELLSLHVEEPPDEAVVAFELNQKIALEKVSFAYATRDVPALDGVSLAIRRGAMLALIGPTGSGKSTLLDLLMGLLQPQEGRILVDDVPLGPATERRWHRSIAHVPQSIFLADSSIARNIALSLPDAPDFNRIVEAARKAQLHEFVASLPEGYDTKVGERGVRLSGGQRQRLGIARAIYKNASVFILDEPTSDLDDLTEAAVMSALDELRREGRTIIIVAHRLSALRHCDTIVRLEDGRVVEIGTGDHLVRGASPIRDDGGLSVAR